MLDHIPAYIDLDLPMPTTSGTAGNFSWDFDLLADAFQKGDGRRPFLEALEKLKEGGPRFRNHCVVRTVSFQAQVRC